MQIGRDRPSPLSFDWDKLSVTLVDVKRRESVFSLRRNTPFLFRSPFRVRARREEKQGRVGLGGREGESGVGWMGVGGCGRRHAPALSSLKRQGDAAGGRPAVPLEARKGRIIKPRFFIKDPRELHFSGIWSRGCAPARDQPRRVTGTNLKAPHLKYTRF